MSDEQQTTQSKPKRPWEDYLTKGGAIGIFVYVVNAINGVTGSVANVEKALVQVSVKLENLADVDERLEQLKQQVIKRDDFQNVIDAKAPWVDDKPKLEERIRKIELDVQGVLRDVARLFDEVRRNNATSIDDQIKKIESKANQVLRDVDALINDYGGSDGTGKPYRSLPLKVPRRFQSIRVAFLSSTAG